MLTVEQAQKGLVVSDEGEMVAKQIRVEMLDTIYACQAFLLNLGIVSFCWCQSV